MRNAKCTIANEELSPDEGTRPTTATINFADVFILRIRAPSGARCASYTTPGAGVAIPKVGGVSRLGDGARGPLEQYCQGRRPAPLLSFILHWQLCIFHFEFSFSGPGAHPTK